MSSSLCAAVLLWPEVGHAWCTNAGQIWSSALLPAAALADNTALSGRLQTGVWNIRLWDTWTFKAHVAMGPVGVGARTEWQHCVRQLRVDCTASCFNSWQQYHSYRLLQFMCAKVIYTIIDRMPNTGINTDPNYSGIPVLLKRVLHCINVICCTRLLTYKLHCSYVYVNGSSLWISNTALISWAASQFILASSHSFAHSCMSMSLSPSAHAS